MKKITLFLTFDHEAEQAARFYTSVFESSKIMGTMPRPDGTLMAVRFQLEGQDFVALNGGPSFTSPTGITLLVNCDTPAQIDALWERLSEGGEKKRCGRLEDRFGVSWQVVSPMLGRLKMSKFVPLAAHGVHAAGRVLGARV
ncbi:MAG TPA: VOC family protein [Polyangiaceae bacterium]|jgi:predicted 3-demethylubiquinone-9 3-methyltransferase (glyoxalase superfamily)